MRTGVVPAAPHQLPHRVEQARQIRTGIGEIGSLVGLDGSITGQHVGKRREATGQCGTYVLPGNRALQQRSDHPAPGQQGGCRPVGRCGPHCEPDFLRRAAGKLLYQPCLADAGGTEHPCRLAAPLAGMKQRGGERLQLGIAANQRHGRRRSMRFDDSGATREAPPALPAGGAPAASLPPAARCRSLC